MSKAINVDLVWLLGMGVILVLIVVSKVKVLKNCTVQCTVVGFDPKN